MPKRTLLFTAFLSLVGSAGAQTLGPVGDPDVYSALQNLRLQGNVFLRLQGSVTVGSTSHAIDCDTYWSESLSSSTSPSVQSELLEYQDNKLMGRVVADGTTVWSYNLVSHEYQTGLYGRYDTGPVSATYLRDALTIMRSNANAYGSFNTKLLDQTFGAAGVTYQTWIPGANVSEQVVSADGTLLDVVYTLGTPVRRQATFHLSSASNTLELLSIDYTDISKQGSQQRVVNWTITPYSVIPSSANFLPYSYSQIPGWRVVSAGN